VTDFPAGGAIHRAGALRGTATQKGPGLLTGALLCMG